MRTRKVSTATIVALREEPLLTRTPRPADPHSPNNASLFRVLSRPSVLASQTPPILDPFQQAKADGEKLRQELDAEKERSLCECFDPSPQSPRPSLT